MEDVPVPPVPVDTAEVIGNEPPDATAGSVEVAVVKASIAVTGLEKNARASRNSRGWLSGQQWCFA